MGIGSDEAAINTGSALYYHRPANFLKWNNKNLYNFFFCRFSYWQITINDLMNADGSAVGTAVIIKTPVVHI